ncbi:MAG TPA: GDSL-type esterase/lipase family protein, partial [Gemmatimonadaceae bacterium]|nr:GDSL-type esterase/lipase family protein [Gemmatimonadaceae bacterium]
MLGLGLAEAFLHLAAALSPRIAFELSPPWSRATTGDSALGFRLSPYFPSHDAWGYRNDSVPVRADVVTIGDSFTYGFAAPSGGSWPRHLAQLSGLTIYNAGVGGYGPCEYEIVLERTSTLEPRTVIVGLHTGNDLGDAYRAVYTDGRCAHLRNSSADLVAELRALDQRGTLADLAAQRGWTTTAPSPDASSTVRSLHRWIARRSQLYALARSVRYAMLQLSAPVRADVGADEGSYDESADREHRVAFASDSVQRTVFKDPAIFELTVDLGDARIREGLRITEQVLGSMHQHLRARNVRLVVALLLDKPAVFAPVVRHRAPDALPDRFYELAAKEER